MQQAKGDTFVIGVDGGGSKTVAVLLDDRGQVRGQGRSGSANVHNVGLAQAQANLEDAMRQATAAAQVDLGRLAAVTWALAGVDRPAERRLFAGLAADLLSGIPVRVENDALAALMGGLGTHHGLVLIAGTGMIAYGENKKGQTARAGGWGHLVDPGSGYALAHSALRAIGDAQDGMGLPTELSQRILRQLGLGQVSDLFGWLYDPGTGKAGVADLAALAPLVLAAAEAGDLAALDIVMRGADSLAEAVAAVARRLGLWESPFTAVLAGGLLERSAFYHQLVSQAIRTACPFAQPARPQADAAVGAALLALESLGLPLQASYPRPAGDPGRAGAVRASEEANVLTDDLDTRPVPVLVGLMHLLDGQAVAAIRPVLPVIAGAVEAIAARMAQGGRLIYAGAGTSGRLGVLDASECRPTFGIEQGRMVALMAGGPAAFGGALEGAEDDPQAGAAALAELAVGPLDSVVGIAASGRTPYVQGALAEAQRRGALAIALVCNVPTPFVASADYVIAPLVGPEALTGSTRLKAGTAQKLVLNMLSTAVMIRLGKTYGNWMINLRAENEKLRKRARRIVAQVCQITDQQAGQALAASGDDVKVAIVTTLANCSPAVARQRLAQAGGRVRQALTQLTEGETIV
jgi:N-acetylmuramic acid 6-phosphate etherase